MRVLQLTHDRTTCSVIDTRDLIDLLDESQAGEEYTLAVVDMTEEEFEELGDFDGF